MKSICKNNNNNINRTNGYRKRLEGQTCPVHLGWQIQRSQDVNSPQVVINVMQSLSNSKRGSWMGNLAKRFSSSYGRKNVCMRILENTHPQLTVLPALACVRGNMRSPETPLPSSLPADAVSRRATVFLDFALPQYFSNFFDGDPCKEIWFIWGHTFIIGTKIS